MRQAEDETEREVCERGAGQTLFAERHPLAEPEDERREERPVRPDDERPEKEL